MQIFFFFFNYLTSCYSPLLTWRDVQHVIARSARPALGGVLIENGDWVKNKAGLAFSKSYGFGLMDGGRMVHLAKHWNTVPPQQRCEFKGQDENRFGFCLFSFRVGIQSSCYFRVQEMHVL